MHILQARDKTQARAFRTACIMSVGGLCGSVKGPRVSLKGRGWPPTIFCCYFTTLVLLLLRIVIEIFLEIRGLPNESQPAGQD